MNAERLQAATDPQTKPNDWLVVWRSGNTLASIDVRYVRPG